MTIASLELYPKKIKKKECHEGLMSLLKFPYLYEMEEFSEEKSIKNYIVSHRKKKTKKR